MTMIMATIMMMLIPKVAATVMLLVMSLTLLSLANFRFPIIPLSTSERIFHINAANFGLALNYSVLTRKSQIKRIDVLVLTKRCFKTCLC